MGDSRAYPDTAATNTYRRLPEVTQRSPGSVSIMLTPEPNWLVLEKPGCVQEDCVGWGCKRGIHPINMQAKYPASSSDNLRICVRKRQQM